MGEDHGQSRRSHRQGRPLEAAKPLPRQPDGQADGHEHLALDDEGGQARRDHPVHGDVQKPELPQPDQHAISRQVADRHVRPTQEQGRGGEGQGEPQGGEGQGRQLAQPDLDHHEIGPPDHGDGQRQQGVAQGERRRGHQRGRSVCGVIMGSHIRKEVPASRACVVRDGPPGLLTMTNVWDVEPTPSPVSDYARHPEEGRQARLEGRSPLTPPATRRCPDQTDNPG